MQIQYYLFLIINIFQFFYKQAMNHPKIKINLSIQQKQIFQMLKLYRQQLKLKTILRVAGGWVRDKIIGKQSVDIDITLDDMKGQAFVKLLKQHAELKNQKISGFGVTKFNPELSKHLETATIKLFDHFIDFVNLRSEKEDIGTPKQDAERRDFTINSLFYNILTEQLEDWTQKGFKDLQNGIIRTPLQPQITFKDDPLRILRCFRFAGRFQFKIVPEIIQAIKNKQIRQALKNKISKERIGLQLFGILNKNPLVGLQYILKTQLWNIVFDIPKQTDLTNQQLIQSIPNYSFYCLQYYLESVLQYKLLTQKQLYLSGEEGQIKDKKSKKIKYSKEQLKPMIHLCCLIVVYRKYKRLGPKDQNLVEYLLKNQLKFSSKITKFCMSVCQSIGHFCSIKSLKDVNSIIRWLRLSEQKWEIILHVIKALHIIEQDKNNIQPLQLRELILNNKWQNTYLVDSHIDGNFLIKRGKKGPILKLILENSVYWRVLNPVKTKQEFIIFFQENSSLFQSDKMYQKQE